mgnify:CR=1 FL=1
MKYLICFFLFIVTSAGFAKQNPLTLISPKSDFRSTKALVLFKGTVDSGSKVFINETPIPVYKNRFYIKAILSPHQENEFNIKNIHPYDIGVIIDKMGVAIRTGNHCTQPIMDKYKIPGTARISFGIYNTKEEINKCLDAIKKAITMLS